MTRAAGEAVCMVVPSVVGMTLSCAVQGRLCSGRHDPHRVGPRPEGRRPRGRAGLGGWRGLRARRAAAARRWATHSIRSLRNRPWFAGRKMITHRHTTLRGKPQCAACVQAFVRRSRCGHRRPRSPARIRGTPLTLQRRRYPDFSSAPCWSSSWRAAGRRSAAGRGGSSRTEAATRRGCLG